MVEILKILLILLLYIIFKEIIYTKIGKNIRKQFILSDVSTKRNILIKIKYNQLSFIMCGIGILLLAIISGNSIQKSLVCGIITYLFLVFYKVLKRNSEKKQILQDLLNVTECLRVQLSSGISLDIALKNIPELCKNKAFSRQLRDLYLEYELSKFTVGSSAREMQNRFNYSEIKIFISALNQQSQSASALEAFDNLIELLKEKYIDYMEENTKTKSLIMVFGVCIIVFNLAIMSIYPLVIEASEALKVMLM